MDFSSPTFKGSIHDCRVGDKMSDFDSNSGSDLSKISDTASDLSKFTDSDTDYYSLNTPLPVFSKQTEVGA